jgi:hypothetical protein
LVENFLTEEPLMSALTQSAATFVAILAGFYTTKILTIAGDKNRIEHKMNYLKSEISFETENIQNFKYEITKMEEEKENRPTHMSEEKDSPTIEINYNLEEEQNFNINNLKRELEEKENKLKFLNQQQSLYREELHSFIYPKHLKFGFFSFGLFAFLGVIIPLMHQWWAKYIPTDPDIFAFSMFLIGLIITFIYMSLEIFSVFKKDNNNNNKS